MISLLVKRSRFVKRTSGVKRNKMAGLLIETFYFPGSKPSVSYSFVCLKTVVKHEVFNFFFFFLSLIIAFMLDTQKLLITVLSAVYIYLWIEFSAVSCKAL